MFGGVTTLAISFYDYSGAYLTSIFVSNATAGSWIKQSVPNAVASANACFAVATLQAAAGDLVAFDGMVFRRQVDVEAWNAPTLLNSWVNFAGGYLAAGYYRDAMGVVHLRGMIKSGVVGSSAFDLPAGYRPTAQTRFACESNSGHGVVVVQSATGSVVPGVGSNAWFSLDGITFDTR